MSLDYKAIGKHIREARRRNHLSQAMLAEAVDKTPCPTDAAACRLGTSWGRSLMPSSFKPTAIAPDETTIGAQPISRSSSS